MEKQTFEIQEGCSKVTVEQIGNQIVTTFEPEKYIPKVGDCVKREIENRIIFGVLDKDFDLSYCVCTYKNEKESEVLDYWCCMDRVFEQITPEELQAEFNKLGYEYDFETHEAKKLKWKPKEGEVYFYVDSLCDISTSLYSHNDRYDNIRYKQGNYYRTYEEAIPRQQYYLSFKD